MRIHAVNSLKMQKRAAVVAAGGLGDGLLMAIVAHNLKRAGYEVSFFHPLAEQLRALFSDYSIFPHPGREQVEEALRSFSCIIVQNNHADYAHSLLRLAKKPPLKRAIFFHTLSRRLESNKSFSIDRSRPIAVQLAHACQQLLNLKEPSIENGLLVPKNRRYRRYYNRIVIHPTGSHPAKCWSEKKFLRLSHQLEALGFDVRFSVHASERADWLAKVADSKKVPLLPDLEALVALLYEASVVIGNDSGVGHLASNLRIPTMTIARNRTKIAFWRPGWHCGSVITPVTMIPNFKGWRLRDMHWEKWISVRRVCRLVTTFFSHDPT
ncbi:MAG: glycosyltransferase family 9 protein [Chlamydiota bacterium]